MLLIQNPPALPHSSKLWFPQDFVCLPSQIVSSSWLWWLFLGGNVQIMKKKGWAILFAEINPTTLSSNQTNPFITILLLNFLLRVIKTLIYGLRNISKIPRIVCGSVRASFSDRCSSSIESYLKGTCCIIESFLIFLWLLACAAKSKKKRF